MFRVMHLDFTDSNIFKHLKPFLSAHVNLCCGVVDSWRQRGRVRALDLKSEGPLFKSSTSALSRFVLGSPEVNSSTALGN